MTIATMAQNRQASGHFKQEPADVVSRFSARLFRPSFACHPYCSSYPPINSLPLTPTPPPSACIVSPAQPTPARACVQVRSSAVMPDESFLTSDLSSSASAGLVDVGLDDIHASTRSMIVPWFPSVPEDLAGLSQTMPWSKTRVRGG